MPDVFFEWLGRPAVLTIAGEYQPGDQPPLGYCDWHTWAEVQNKAGLRDTLSDVGRNGLRQATALA